MHACTITLSVMLSVLPLKDLLTKLSKASTNMGNSKGEFNKKLYLDVQNKYRQFVMYVLVFQFNFVPHSNPSSHSLAYASSL